MPPPVSFSSTSEGTDGEQSIASEETNDEQSMPLPVSFSSTYH